MKQLYLLNNGQKPDCFTGAWWGLAFIPLNHLVEYHLSKNTPIDMTSQDTSFHERAIKLYNTNPKWVPFAEDGAFNYLAIDLDPDINGTVGQVINFGRDEREKCVIARSLENFLDFMTKEIENGNYTIEDYGFGGKVFNYKSSHLLYDLKDSIAGKN